MRRDGPDKLIKIASLGGGGVAIGGNLQKTANRNKRIKKEIEKAKTEDALYELEKRKIKMKYGKSKELAKKAAKKKLKKSKQKCPKCSGKGCSHCGGKGYHE